MLWTCHFIVFLFAVEAYREKSQSNVKTKQLDESNYDAYLSTPLVYSTKSVKEKTVFMEEALKKSEFRDAAALSEVQIKNTPLDGKKYITLAGNDILGCGYDAARAIEYNLDTVTRQIFNGIDNKLLKIGQKEQYGYPGYVSPSLNFDTTISTLTFSSMEEKAKRLALESNIDLRRGMFMGKGREKTETGNTYLYSISRFRVELYQLRILNLEWNDLSNNFRNDFNELPEKWSLAPDQYQTFVKRYGTHFVDYVKVGGVIEMDGKISKDVSNNLIDLAALISSKFKSSLLHTKSRNERVSFLEKHSGFTYNTRGGNPVAGVILTTAQNTSNIDGKSTMFSWLESIKRVPQAIGFHLRPLSDLIEASNAGRLRALKRAIQVYYDETNNPDYVEVKSHTNFWSNFYQLPEEGKCIVFSGSIGKGDHLVVSFRSVVNDDSQKRRGYTLDVDTHRAVIFKGSYQDGDVLSKKQGSKTEDLIALVTGDAKFFSTYKICFRQQLGKNWIQYWHRGTIVLQYVDEDPEPIYFYGFLGEQNNGSVIITDLRMSDWEKDTCRFYNGKMCGGRGFCPAGSLGECSCDHGFSGYDCSFECAKSINSAWDNQGCVNYDHGICEKGDNGAVCKCKQYWVGSACDQCSAHTLILEHGHWKGVNNTLTYSCDIGYEFMIDGYVSPLVFDCKMDSSGWFHEGISECSKINYCLQNICLNDGVCKSLLNDFECTCPEHFYAKDCSLDCTNPMNKSECSFLITATPSVSPTPPTSFPTVTPPTSFPTAAPTISPSATPTIAPSTTPTVAPSSTPTISPSAVPTISPTANPSAAPTSVICNWQKKGFAKGIESDGTYNSDAIPTNLCNFQNKDKLIATLGKPCTYMGFVEVPPGDWCLNETNCENFNVYICACVVRHTPPKNESGTAFLGVDLERANKNKLILTKSKTFSPLGIIKNIKKNINKHIKKNKSTKKIGSLILSFFFSGLSLILL